LLNFNVGEGLKFALPNSFWTSLQAQFGSLFYVREQGEDQVSFRLFLIFEVFCVTNPSDASAYRLCLMQLRPLITAYERASAPKFPTKFSISDRRSHLVLPLSLLREREKEWVATTSYSRVVL
jgi:hypothetical protein